MNAPYALTPDAARERDEAMAYIAQDSPDAALRLYAALEVACGSLAMFPGMGHRRTDFMALPVRFWCVVPYWLVYDPAPRPIRIVAVLHAAQDIAARLADLRLD